MGISSRVFVLDSQFIFVGQLSSGVPRRQIACSPDCVPSVYNENVKANKQLLFQETLQRICCAMLILVRRRLLAGDFTSNLKLLQNYPPTNISHLLYVANKLRAQPSG